MVDTTANVTESELEKMKQFIGYSMARFSQLDESFMMGVMQFSDKYTAKMVRRITSYNGRNSLDDDLTNMELLGHSERFTGEALVEAGKTVRNLSNTVFLDT